MSQKFSRSCPRCGIEIVYQNKFLLDQANSKNTKCKKCREHKLLSAEIISLILELNDKGISNREIGRKLGLHHPTVSYHIRKNGGKKNWADQIIDIVSDTEARCCDCKEIKPITEFWYKTENYEWKFGYCQKCREKRYYLKLNSNVDKFLKNRFQQLKNRAKRSKIDFNLTLEYFLDQYKKQNGLCFYTDEEMICKVGIGKNRNSFSIDKIIPTKGYVLGNVVFCTNKINMSKNDLTLEEIKQWMPGWYSRIEKFLGAE